MDNSTAIQASAAAKASAQNFQETPSQSPQKIRFRLYIHNIAVKEGFSGFYKALGARSILVRAYAAGKSFEKNDKPLYAGGAMQHDLAANEELRFNNPEEFQINQADLPITIECIRQHAHLAHIRPETIHTFTLAKQNLEKSGRKLEEIAVLYRLAGSKKPLGNALLPETSTSSAPSTDIQLDASYRVSLPLRYASALGH